MQFINIACEPDVILLETEQEWVKLVSERNVNWCYRDVEVMTKKNCEELNVNITAKVTPIKRVVLKWNRTIEQDIRILGDHWERGYGDLEWRGIVPERVMPWYFLVNDKVFTHGYGVKTGPKAMCFWQLDKSCITLVLDVRCGGSGVILKGKMLNAATVVSREGLECESPFKVAKEFCSLMCEKPLMPAKPVYGGNNWYYAYGNSSHKQIIEDSKFISDLSISTENRPFMVIDDGWQLCHNDPYNGGPWKYSNYLFPDMQRLAYEMKEIGVRPGIWNRPLLTIEKVDKTWILPDKRCMNKPDGIVLDPSVPEVLNKISEDVKVIANWGYELLKHDFSTYDIFGRWGFQMNGEITNDNWSFSDPSKTTAEIILELYKTIKTAAGSSLVIGCNTISHLAAGIFEIQRTGDDTSGKQWKITRKMGINTLAYRMSQHGTFYAVDADCVGITSKIPWELNKQWLELLAMSGTPLFVSADRDVIGTEQKKSLQKAFSYASKVLPNGEPLDWLYTTCPEQWNLNGEVVNFDWRDMNKVGAFK